MVLSKLLSRLIYLFLLPMMIAFSCIPGKIGMEEYAAIQEGFTNLHDTNRLWCYYYWIDGDISHEGVTSDLEAMKEFGIGACLIGNIYPGALEGVVPEHAVGIAGSGPTQEKVPLFSEEWWDITVHVVNEGKRLGIDVGFFNCPGWSQSGGPWITPDKAMRHLVYSETRVKGPGYVRLQLPKPAEEFQDTYVLAFRTEEAGRKEAIRKDVEFILSPAVFEGEHWAQYRPDVFGIQDGEVSIEISSSEPIRARSIAIHPDKGEMKCSMELQARVNDEYIAVKSFEYDRSNPNVNVGPVTHGPVAISLPGTESSSFRLVCSDLVSNTPHAGFTRIVISENAVLERYVEKSLGKMHQTPLPEYDSYMWETQDAIPDRDLLIGELYDISEYMDKNGIMEGDALEGEWTVLRLGMTPTGTRNNPASPQGEGLEVDKASAELARFHFEQFIKKILDRVPEENRSAFKYVIADSYEMGSQNWTDDFAARFRSRYGYDPVRFLPVISGRIVRSAEESDRFLWDMRRAMADDIAHEYVGGLRKVSNEHNLRLWLENYGHWGFPSEFLMYGGQSDMVAGEYWNEGTLGDIECKSASSAAHIYGKPRTSAEAFTSGMLTYLRHPSFMKKRGDWCITEGINHFVMHLYMHQPDDQRIPGINTWFGTEFNRHNTWFGQGKHWADYLRRCQHLQQQGNYAADVCYFIGEDVPKMTGICDPELPPGYSYDYINAEVIRERLTVENGAFVLPDGMTYKLMVLPNINTMRPEVLERIAELVSLGGTILGPKPEKSPSLQNYPACDSKVKKLAGEMWTEDHEGRELKNPYGEGFVLDGMDVQEALDFLGVTRDVEVGEDIPVLWTHRTMPGMEIYFLTNQSDDELHFSPSFRVKGLKPQLWDAVTGEIRNLRDYYSEGGRTSLPVRLRAQESCYIVFTNNMNEMVKAGYGENFPEKEKVITLEGDWEIEFMNKTLGPAEPLIMESLADWTSSEDDAVKYYSGTAVYRKSFVLDEVPDKGDLFIDLGEVNVMATVKLNGQEIGGTWMAPYLVNTGNALKTGENSLEVEVVNTWRNRLIYEKEMPAGERHTFILTDDIKPGELPQPSGLLGPVTIEMIKHSF